MSTAQISVPLDISDVQVLQTQISSRGEFIITLESTLTSARCHRCGRELCQFYGLDKWVTVRHLPILGRPVYLRYRPKRYRCEECDGHPTTTQQLTCIPQIVRTRRPMTDTCCCNWSNATIEDVSLKERLAYDRVLGVLERCIAAEVGLEPVHGLERTGTGRDRV